jgi:hypothetical protein
MPCTQCQALEGKLARTTEPHADLILVGHTNGGGRGGIAQGAIEEYKCSVCGEEWTRDLDKNDRAPWQRK